MIFNRTNFSQQKNYSEKNYCTLALDVLSGPHFGISPIVVCSPQWAWEEWRPSVKYQIEYRKTNKYFSILAGAILSSFYIIPGNSINYVRQIARFYPKGIHLINEIVTQNGPKCNWYHLHHYVNCVKLTGLADKGTLGGGNYMLWTKTNQFAEILYRN